MRRWLAAAAVLLLGLLGGVAPVASAVNNNVLSSACNAGPGAGASVACDTSSGNDPITGTDGVIYKAARLVAFVAGATAVIIMLYGSFQYITAGGDAKKAASGRSAIIGSAVGLIIIAAAQTILLFALKSVK